MFKQYLLRSVSAVPDGNATASFIMVTTRYDEVWVEV
jgi:hypothetical protein